MGVRACRLGSAKLTRPSPPNVVPSSAKSAWFWLIGSNCPLQRAQPFGAKLNEKIRISERNGSAMTSLRLLHEGADNGRSGGAVQDVVARRGIYHIQAASGSTVDGAGPSSFLTEVSLMSPAAVGRRGLVAAFTATLIAGSSVRATRSRELHTGLPAAATPAAAAAVRWKVTAQRTSPAAPDTTPVAITGVTVIDVARARRVRAQTAVTRGTRGAGVGTRVTVPRGARLVDGRGKILMPGLWDMHVHVLMAGPRLSLLPLYVANGVTRVRDMGGTMPLDEQRAVRRALEAGERVGPVVAAAPGPILTAP